MGNKSSKSDSNSFKSDSESSSNSGQKDGRLETMECKPSNSNTTIKRSWIIKKSISLSDEHIIVKNIFKESINLSIINFCNKLPLFNLPPIESDPLPGGIPKETIFNSTNEWNGNFKHWAIILELSNDSFANIQFGRNGFSLKEFNPTEIKGENILDAIVNAWGQPNFPVSFCYLGDANFDYEKFKNILREIKEKEIKIFKVKGKAYYNLPFRNCQHFACDIEKILFTKIRVWHSFDYYFKDFFKTFFPNINIGELESKIDEKYTSDGLKKKREDIAFLFGQVNKLGERLTKSDKKMIEELLREDI